MTHGLGRPGRPTTQQEFDVADYKIGDASGKWPEKAYKNLGFLNSASARSIRILCEYIEPRVRFETLGIKDTVVFFGSARTLSAEQAQDRLESVEADGRGGHIEGDELERRLKLARRDLDMSRYYEDARELARRLTEWAMQLTDNGDGKRFAICSGGGPGIMEAVNRGATDAGGPSIGLNISLPMEQQPNPYQTPELSFEFHYFFIRKFWFTCPARALVAFPGGFGTMDELFELLTLTQTNKSPLKIPMLLYGSDFWSKAVDFDYLLETGVISPEDHDLYRRFDDVDTAFEFLKTELTRHFLDPDQDCLEA